VVGALLRLVRQVACSNLFMCTVWLNNGQYASVGRCNAEIILCPQLVTWATIGGCISLHFQPPEMGVERLGV